jgi:hypothetical protein
LNSANFQEQINAAQCGVEISAIRKVVTPAAQLEVVAHLQTTLG